MDYLLHSSNILTDGFAIFFKKHIYLGYYIDISKHYASVSVSNRSLENCTFFDQGYI